MFLRVGAPPARPEHYRDHTKRMIGVLVNSKSGAARRDHSPFARQLTGLLAAGAIAIAAGRPHSCRIRTF
jgi:hypothetical protein